MEMVPLEPTIGVEIRGVQMAEADGDTLDAIRRAVWEHGVAVFRDQSLTPEQHIAFAKRWGGIDLNNYFPLHEAQPEIALVKKRADQVMNIGGGWHTDHSYDAVPAMGSILVARELPPSGGDTLFAHMGAAYDLLAPEVKQQIEGLRAWHSADHVYSPEGVYAQTDMASELRGQDLKAGAEHPVVIRHPQTGCELLYVNPGFTTHSVGMTRDESLGLLQQLYAAAVDPAHQYRLEWREGTVAIWDNRTTWHYALNDYQGYAREMHRITLTGELLAA